MWVVENKGFIMAEGYNMEPEQFCYFFSSFVPSIRGRRTEELDVFVWIVGNNCF